MAISTAAVLYSFFAEVKSPKRDLELWKCVDMGFQHLATLLAPQQSYAQRQISINNRDHHYKIQPSSEPFGRFS